MGVRHLAVEQTLVCDGVGADVGLPQRVRAIAAWHLALRRVLSGVECGLGIKNFNDLKEGDIIEGYEEIEVKRTL